MEQSTSHIILEELRALRADYNSHARQTGERLASLEEAMHALVGNGQPGRVGKLETTVLKLQQWRWYLLGACAATSGIVTTAVWIAAELRK